MFALYLYNPLFFNETKIPFSCEIHAYQIGSKFYTVITGVIKYIIIFFIIIFHSVLYL